MNQHKNFDQYEYEEALIQSLEDSFSNKLFELRDDTEKLEQMFSDGGGDVYEFKSKFYWEGGE